MEEYICPKCRTKVILKKNKKMKSLFCPGCVKTGELTVLRKIISSTENYKK